MKRFLLSLSLLLLVIGSQAADFKFAFLTDIHITAGDSLPCNDLARSVDQINATPGIDFAIVSGDITNLGDRRSMEVVKSLLDRLEVPYYIVPGNHETKWSESGVTDFARIFGRERFRFEHDGVLFLGMNSGPIIRMADGHVAPQDIDWLKRELSAAGPEKPVIVVTHYPLQPGDVDNWYDVTDAIRPYNIRLVMGGHYHQYLNLKYDGIPGILCRSNLRDKAPVRRLLALRGDPRLHPHLRTADRPGTGAPGRLHHDRPQLRQKQRRLSPPRLLGEPRVSPGQGAVAGQVRL